MIKCLERRDLSHLTEEQRVLAFRTEGVQPRTDAQLAHANWLVIFEDGIKIAWRQEPPKVKND